MKSITFNEQINIFLEKKTKGTLSMRTQESACTRSHDHAHTGTILCMHGEF